MADRTLTDVELERHLAGELPDARFAEATDADRARLAELRAEHDAFLRTVDVDLEVKRIAQRVERSAPPKRSLLRWLVPAGALAAAAIVALVVLRPDDTSAPVDDLTPKGDTISLVVHRATADGSQRLAPGDTVSAGDRLRFELGGTTPGYVAIIGIDGSGTPAVYHPDGGSAPVVFDPANVLVPGAIALDATPGSERFYAVFSERPFSLDVVLPALATSTPLPPGVSKAEVVLEKR